MELHSEPPPSPSLLRAQPETWHFDNVLTKFVCLPITSLELGMPWNPFQFNKCEPIAHYIRCSSGFRDYWRDI